MSRKEFIRQIVEHLGTVKNVSRLFIESLECEHQAGIGKCFSAFDVENKGEVRLTQTKVVAKTHPAQQCFRFVQQA